MQCKQLFRLLREHVLRCEKLALLLAVTFVTPLLAQQDNLHRIPPQLKALANPSAAALQKQDQMIESVLEPELIFKVQPSQSKIVKTRLPITRVAITDAGVIDVNEISPAEIEIVGKRAGQTTMTLWFQNGDQETILRYLVLVAANDIEQERGEVEFGRLQTRINELYPNSYVQLIPIADKLIVRGQARDSKEAAEILAIVGSQSLDQGGNIMGGGVVNVGSVAKLPGAEDLATTSVVNLLHVPGEQQVMLKVRIAEITRSALRELGADFDIVKNSWSLSHFIGGAGNLTAILDNQDVNLFIRAFTTNGYGKLLAEPTLVTLSGQSANFISGGEFAVPTAVGIDGIGAVSTTFRGFGTQLAFTPTVIDKDRIRLNVAPSFSSVNQDNTVDGIPGLDVRGAMTTVDLREGQWLAIAGLIQDQQGGNHKRLPFLGDIPVAGAVFGNQKTDRQETELVILVSPELVHPLEFEQVPLLLPGMEVTDPTDAHFFFLQQTEGCADHHYRSTVWPQYRNQLHFDAKMAAKAMRQSKRHSKFHVKQQQYIVGPHGFSE